MEDEEEVIMALITALPSLVYCLGGKEYSPLIFESLEMLLFVDNPVIKLKVSGDDHTGVPRMQISS
jgi:hypothetical protein